MCYLQFFKVKIFAHLKDNKLTDQLTSEKAKDSKFPQSLHKFTWIYTVSDKFTNTFNIFIKDLNWIC